MRWLISAVAMCLSLATGCATLRYPRDPLPKDIEAALRDAPVVYLHAIDPSSGYAAVEVPEDDAEPSGKTGEAVKLTPTLSNIGPFDITGSVALDGQSRKRLVSAAIGAMRYGISRARCFEPRHALEVRDGTNRVALLICFACNIGEAYRDGVVVDSYRILDSPEPDFDRILAEHGIEKAR